MAPKPPPPDLDDVDRSVSYFRDRIPMTDEDFDALDEELRGRAFRIAGVNQLALVSDVWEALDDAIANGDSFGDFKAEVSERLSSAWGGEKPWKVENLFRTWTQRAYSAGRYEMMTDPDVKEARPFWEYVEIDDGRVCPICSECGGTVRLADDPWWASHIPPTHSACRCSHVSLTPEEAAGRADDPPPNVEAAPGFGGPPDEDFEPDLSRYPPQLVDAYQRRLDERRNR